MILKGAESFISDTGVSGKGWKHAIPEWTRSCHCTIDNAPLMIQCGIVSVLYSTRLCHFWVNTLFFMTLWWDLGGDFISSCFFVSFPRRALVSASLCRHCYCQFRLFAFSTFYKVSTQLLHLIIVFSDEKFWLLLYWVALWYDQYLCLSTSGAEMIKLTIEFHNLHKCVIIWIHDGYKAVTSSVDWYCFKENHQNFIR